MKVQKASIAVAWPWMIMSHGDDYVDPDDILAKVKGERLARLFAASDDLLAACKLWVGAEQLAEGVEMLDRDALEKVQFARSRALAATRAAIKKMRE